VLEGRLERRVGQAESLEARVLGLRVDRATVEGAWDDPPPHVALEVVSRGADRGPPVVVQDDGSTGPDDLAEEVEIGEDLVEPVVGFTFSCEDKGGVNPPTGQLRIQLSYTDHGSNPIGSSFSIQGTADELDPVLESMMCTGQNPPPGGNELIFLGRYRPTTPPPPGFPTTCPRRETSTSPLCRFEVIVRDTDGNLAASKGDFFSIKLSSATAVTAELDPATVFYVRAGYLERGNLTVK
jgi:hypothetical protein